MLKRGGFRISRCKAAPLASVESGHIVHQRTLPMDGASWIHDILAILDHFAIWSRSKTCQENIVLIFFGSQCKIQGKINAQINFGHNFWLEGHTDLRWTPLSYIFPALSRDTPLGHFYHEQPNSQIAKLAKYLDIWLFGYLVRYFEHSQVGYPWKEHDKCSSEALTWGPYDPPVKSYGRNRFLHLFSLVFFTVSQKK